MKKKSVTAPLTYDPGKGRPKEHLAYLNWQEMQALKRLNGNNQERGPKGLPSFPPRGTTGKSSSSVGSKTTSKSTSKAGSKDVGGKGNSGVGSQKSSTSRGPAASQAAAKASASKATGARGPTGPKGEARSSPAASQTSKASASLSRGSTKTVNVGPMGTPVSVKTGGSQIKGAIQRVQQPVNYTSAPRYKQPQAERMANPTAIPSNQRSAYERMTAADAKKSMQSALDARVQRKNLARQAEIARAGVFGAPNYTGMYNPQTNRFDARPKANTTPAARVQTPVAMDPSFRGRIAEAEKNYRIASSGPYASRVYSDPDIKSPSIGDTISDYASSAYDAVAGGIRSLGSAFPSSPVPGTMTSNVPGLGYSPDVNADLSGTLSDYAGRAYDAVTGGLRAIGNAMPPNVFTRPSSATFTDKIGPTLKYSSPIGPQRPAPGQTVYKNQSLSAESLLDAPPSRLGNADPAALKVYSDSVPLGSFTPPAREVDLTQGAYERAVSGNMMRYPYAVDVRKDTLSRINEAIDYQKSLGAKPPAAKTRGLDIQPMGATVASEEKILSVEDVPEALNYAKVKTKENILPFQPRTYDSPYPTDENGVPIQNVSEADLAKIRARRRGEEYAPTPEERRAILAAKVATAPIVSRIPGAKKAFNVEGNITDYYSRPSWEKQYIKDRAAASIGFGDVGAGRSSTDRPTTGGISNLPTATTTTPSAPTTGTPVTSGTRPYIYYQWDLGMNVPSPSDPNYTQYQKYLSEREARRVALGMA